jgi:hypothetical protein
LQERNDCINGRGGGKYVSFFAVIICTIFDNTSTSVQNISSFFPQSVECQYMQGSVSQIHEAERHIRYTMK